MHVHLDTGQGFMPPRPGRDTAVAVVVTAEARASSTSQTPNSPAHLSQRAAWWDVWIAVVQHVSQLGDGQQWCAHHRHDCACKAQLEHKGADFRMGVFLHRNHREQDSAWCLGARLCLGCLLESTHHTKVCHGPADWVHGPVHLGLWAEWCFHRCRTPHAWVCLSSPGSRRSSPGRTRRTG